MTAKEEKMALLNITEGAGNTNMAVWKYEIYRNAILKAIPPGEEGLLFTSLPSEVSKFLPEKDRHRLGSLAWHVTSVKLDMEARGLIRRLEKIKPQRLQITDQGLEMLGQLN